MTKQPADEQADTARKGESCSNHILSREQMNAICEFDTCTIANAIETFNIRLRNEGYTQPGLRCFYRYLSLDPRICGNVPDQIFGAGHDRKCLSRPHGLVAGH